MYRILFATLVAAIPPALIAQPGGPRGPHTPGLNLTAVQTLEGPIAKIYIGYGLQFPSILVAGKNVRLAPAWFLLDNDLELTTGEQVRLTVAPANRTPDPYLYALQITRLQVRATLALRNEEGTPLWTRSRRSGQGIPPDPPNPKTGAPCIDLETLRTETGLVHKVNAGEGLQFPTLEFVAASGQFLVLHLAPERILLGGDFEMNVGDTMSVKYAPVPCNGEFAALQITDAAGRILVLRNDDGTPAWR
jgi:hypothetical protein